MQRKPDEPFSREQRILLWILTALLVAGLAASSLIERRRTASLELVPADALDLAAGMKEIESGRIVRVNEGAAWQIEALPGIGPELAKRIVSHRKTHGPFSAPEDLLAVKGIGPAKLAGFKDRLAF